MNLRPRRIHQRQQQQICRRFFFLFVVVVIGISSIRSVVASTVASSPPGAGEFNNKTTSAFAISSNDDTKNSRSVKEDECAADIAMTSTNNTYEQDGAEARAIAAYLPYFPFKGIPRFYDIGGFLYEPKIFQRIVDIFSDRYRAIGIDVIVGLDARGFILGPPIALALQKPFVMMRKQGKMPNTISSDEYQTEYGSRSGLTVQRDKIRAGQRVLIIDDLVATGGTLSSAITLVKALKGVVVECACVVELKMFIHPSPESGLPNRSRLMQEQGHEAVPIWGLISEDILTVEAKLPDNYVDDGEGH